ncbi:MAG: SDR family oxidoreductase [Bacteroidia bacterium]
MNIFITGGTGYIGRRLIAALLKRNHTVKALVRRGSENKLNAQCTIVYGDALNAATFQNEIGNADTFIHLVGVARPSPKKKEQFQTIDLTSIKATVEAIKFQNKKPHLIYLSVAQTSTEIMKDFQAVRAQGEMIIKEANINATFIRPWYVIGPGHYWPLLLLPFLKIAELIPSKSKKAKALRLVYLPQMIRTLVNAAEHPTTGIRMVEIDEIRGSRTD